MARVDISTRMEGSAGVLVRPIRRMALVATLRGAASYVKPQTPPPLKSPAEPRS
jgi:hypothetical protein